MSRKKIMQELNVIFIKLFKNSKIKLTENVAEHDIDDWDSMHHIQLIVAIEAHFKIRFTTSDIQAPKHIANIVDIIEQKLKISNHSN